MNNSDVIIVGSGVAALQLARKLSRDLNVIILTKSFMNHGNSVLAQGGIAAAWKDRDHPIFHFIDTMEAGRKMNHSTATFQLTQEAPQTILDLMKSGCEFDLDADGNLALGIEGAHSQHRIVHGGGDQTGKIVMDCLSKSLPPNVKVLEYQFVCKILTSENGCCFGVESRSGDGEMNRFLAPHIILSTGGCGNLYSHTSNADTATGDGITLAYYAGAEVADMEFIQFHPTLAYINQECKGLISEAVRGEGAALVDELEKPIMEGVHPFKDLAPRHIVAQTIFHHRQKGHEIYLNIRGIENFSGKFPSITKMCEWNRIDLTQGMIPVTPGCHFSMGGVKTDSLGRTTLKGLYAIGEVACTGVHGANRLASNSLLEGLVFGRRLAEHLNSQSGLPRPPFKEIMKKTSPSAVCLPPVEELQKRMMTNVGIARKKSALEKHLQWLESYNLIRCNHLDFTLLTNEQIKVLFMMKTAWLITKSALEREESRGGHYREDFPEELPLWQSKQIIQKKTYEMRKTNEPVETQT
ncbi:L-aspartate oxidase [Halobacillus litoralis]|uniref:L-aspartate oxidase n=1 Tax=Halobacillus litoralis TaxID=45668 RepID=UPI00248F4C09|nr:L-aspartate oxidase [Halobacillus litoralis]